MDGNESGRRRRLGLRLGVAAVAVAAVGWAAEAAPAGRETLRNADFSDDPQRPTHWVTYGSGQYADFVLGELPDGGAGRMLTVTVKAAVTPFWAAQLRQGLTEPMQKGDWLRVAFQYKMTPGFVFHCFWQLEQAPWPKLMSIRVTEPADAWQEFSMVTRVPADMPERGTSLAMHLAEQAGTIQFRGLTVRLYPPDTPPAALASTIEPVLGGDENDRAWRQEAQRRLEQVRRGQVRIQVTTAAGPAAGAVVRIEQERRAFRFGVTVPPALFQPGGAIPAGPLQEQLRGVEDKVEKYRAKVLDPRLFSSVTFDDLVPWSTEAQWPEATGPALVEPIARQGFEIRGHYLFCPALRFAPPACRQMSDEALRAALAEFVTRQVRRYAGSIHEWDVVHAALTHHEIYDRLGEAVLAQAFSAAREADPNAVLVLADDQALTAPGDEHLQELLSVCAWLRSQGAPLQGLAFEASFGTPYMAPVVIEARLSQAAAAGLPIQIIGLGVSAQTEDLQAARLEDLLTLFFSHPAVTGISLGGVWEALLPPPGRPALFRQNLATKPAGKVVDHLLREAWWSSGEATCDAEGSLTFAGFHGRYVAIVKLGDREERRPFTIPADGDRVALKL